MATTTTLNLISKQTVGADGASSVTFSNIPQTYTDLVVKISARTTSGSAGGYQTFIRLNGDSSTSSYSWRNLLGLGASTVSQNSTTDPGMRIFMSSSSGDTASTFGNGEIVIANYTSSNKKSLSADSVSENNATSATADLAAGLWNGTSAVTSVTLYPDSSSFAQYSTFYLYGVSNSSTQNASVPYASGGDVITTDGTYWYHAFKSSGTFTPLKALSCDVLVVAGGGGSDGSSSYYSAGGGGAGGLVYTASQSFASGTAYTATIGAGGNNTNGSNSNLTGGSLSLTAAVGGGKGGNASPSNGGNGGSGGGAGSNANAARSGGSATSGQGYAGGAGNSSGLYRSGGGGGAGGAGGDAQVLGDTGPGGVGSSTYSSWLSATSLGQKVSTTYYIAGGGSGTGGSGASGGYGGGGGSDGTNGTNGTANTGGGGGGSGTSSGSIGGSGVIIVRYAV